MYYYQRLQRHEESVRRASMAIEIADEVHDSSKLEILIIVDPNGYSIHICNAAFLAGWCAWL